MRAITIMLLTLLGQMSGTPLLAEECEAPCLGYAFSGELQADWLVSATPSEREGSDFEPTVDLEFYVTPVDGVRLVTVLTAESVFDWEAGEDRAFKDLGLYTSNFYLHVDFEPVTFRLGRFTPAFGMASEQLSGINVEGFAGDYDNDDKVGAEVEVGLGGNESSHTLTVSAFTNDRSQLSRSIGAEREILEREDGGAGNVEGVGSVALSYTRCVGAEADDCFYEGEYGVRLGIRIQGKGEPSEEQSEEQIDPRDESGLLAAASRRIPLANDSSLKLLGEIALFRNFEGEDSDAMISTASIAYDTDDTVYFTSYSHALARPATEANETSHFFGLGALHEIGETALLNEEDWLLEAAYNYVEATDEESSHFVSLKLSVEFDGSRAL